MTFLLGLLVIGLIGAYFGLGPLISGIGGTFWQLVEMFIEWAFYILIAGILIGMLLRSCATT